VGESNLVITGLGSTTYWFLTRTGGGGRSTGDPLIGKGPLAIPLIGGGPRIYGTGGVAISDLNESGCSSGVLWTFISSLGPVGFYEFYSLFMEDLSVFEELDDYS
jgi:hypothetical protein